ncbi:MAG TPA: SRPBCC domain-containing protein [Casimicrobiaceae bacterium]|nr:SRPBCC domain-containing protein [Casimicrobiaceae bacterium]
MEAVRQKPSLSIVRRFDVEPAEVWRAWTDPRALSAWMAPSDAFSTRVLECDVRVGGRYRIVMRTPEGEDNDVSGVYREVVANRKLVFTWAWKSTPERESVVTVELRAAGRGTELTLKHEEFAEGEARDRHNQGWNACLARLGRMLAAQDA